MENGKLIQSEKVPSDAIHDEVRTQSHSRRFAESIAIDSWASLWTNQALLLMTGTLTALIFPQGQIACNKGHH